MKLIPILFSALAFAPGAKSQSYWQQKADTKIEVILDDENHFLRGFEKISYFNNSPDTLSYIYIHLWPNAYAHDHTPFAEQQYRNGKTDFYYAGTDERGFIDSLNFSVDGEQTPYFSHQATPDIGRIHLLRPLLPGKHIEITTPFRVKIPKVFSRLGHSGQAYFISQWFPKPAVYDKKGWHPMPYLELGEFYSEFGSYDVTISLPKNYVVMATGNLETPSEETWLDSLSKLPAGKRTERKITVTKTTRDGKKKRVQSTTDFPESSTEWKTIRFTEDNVHDFAWFADKRWAVRKDSVSNPENEEKIIVWTAFLPDWEKQWKKAGEHLKNTIKYYGKWVGPYPYKTIKAVQGDMKAGGGMEYPTITVIDKDAGDQTTLIHEAGHNWFYGILATNERDHAWMDEGMNTFYEQKTSIAIHKQDTSKKSRPLSISFPLMSVLYQLAATNNDQAIAQTSDNFKEINYGLDVYYKTAGMMNWLEAYMEKQAFDAAMKDYFETWKFRHPYPEDFRSVLEKHTTKPLGWFFDEALRTDRLVDFSIKKVKTQENGLSVTVKNKTGRSYPVIINAYQNDSLLASATTEPFTETVSLWMPPEARSWTKIKIDPAIPDGRTPNNEYRKNGLLRRSGLSLRPLAGTNLSPRQKIFFLPALGYNAYDGFEAGLLLHNLTWPETKLKFILAPMYGFSPQEFIGAASASYSFYPKKRFKEIFLQTDFKSFDYQKTDLNISKSLYARYWKIAPSLNFVFHEPVATSPVTRTLSFKGYGIREEGFDFNLDVSDSLYKPGLRTEENYYGFIRYSHFNRRIFNPFNYAFEGQFGAGFSKISFEGNLRIDYHLEKKSFYIRGFAGKFFDFNNGYENERYYLNSVFTGTNDYLYDDTYIGRTEREDFGARQVSIREGGLKIPTPLYASPLGRSDNWLAALNFKTDLPFGNLPIRLFFDVAGFSDAARQNPSGNKFLFDGGVELYLGEIVEVYFPFIASKDFQDYRKTISGKTGFFDGFAFSINLQQINWLKTPSGIINQRK